MGIDGYRQMASRYPNFGSVSKAFYGPDMKCPGKPALTVPSEAEIHVFKTTLKEPSVGVARWSEFAPREMDDPNAFMWRKMPYHMLAKCAEALALRKAYPDLADIYTKEEMMQSTGREDEPAAVSITERVPLALQQFEDRASEQNAQMLRDTAGQHRAIDVKAQPPQTDCLFYAEAGRDRYLITGPDAIKTSVRELLLPLWNADAGELYGTAAQVGKLIAQLETRGVKIRRREREAGE